MKDNFNQLNKPKHLKHLNISCKCLTFSSVEKVQNENYYFLVTLIAFVDLIFLVYEKVGIGLNNLLFHSFLVNDVIRQSLSHLKNCINLSRALMVMLARTLSI